MGDANNLIGSSYSQFNDGKSLYGDLAQYRLRLFYNHGQSPNGVVGLTPDAYLRYFTVILDDGREIETAGVAYDTDDGSITVVGLADLGQARDSCDGYADFCYGEDTDNYIDIILSGDEAAMAHISSVHIEPGLFNPGGPPRHSTTSSIRTPTQTNTLTSSMTWQEISW